MRAPPRLLAALLAGSLVGLPGCKDVRVYEPATPAEVRAAAAKPGPDQAVRFKVPDDKPFGEGRFVPPRTPDASYETTAGEVRNLCATPGKCPLDDPTARWELGSYHRVADGSLILTDTLLAGFLIGVPAANIVCFGTDKCSDGVKTGVVVTDVVIGSALVIGLFALALGFRNFRGD